MKNYIMLTLALFASLFLANEAYDLVLLHTNDVHAHYIEFNENGGRCPKEYAEEGKCFGGFARQSTKIKEIRANNSNVLFLNGGDFFQGTVWYTLYKYKAVAEFVNKLTIDSMSLGNHEFDDGLKDLIPYLKSLEPKVVICNVDSSQEPEFHELVKPSTVLEIGGEKIGVIGYLTPETKYLSSTGKLEFSDEVECIQKEAKRLTEEGINKIFAVGHSGLVVDKDIAEKVPEVDIVVGGHTNSFLYTGTPPSVEEPQGPYPMEINRADGSKALVVQDFAFGKYLGYLEVSFTEDGKVDHWSGNPILLDSSVKQDSEILELLEPYAQEVEKRGKEEVGKTNVLLDGNRLECRMRECNLGNYLADAALDYFISAPTDKGWTNVAVAVWNSGGIRGSIDERLNNGSVILEDLLTIAPFGNTMDIVALKGKHVREVLERSVEEYDHEALDPSGAFLQVSGLRILYDVTKPPGSRVMDVSVRCTDCRVPKLEPLEEEQIYEIVIPTYLAKGGDGFSMISENSQGNRNTDELDLDIITAYMHKIKPIIHGLEERITVLSSQSAMTRTNLFPRSNLFSEGNPFSGGNLIPGNTSMPKFPSPTDFIPNLGNLGGFPGNFMPSKNNENITEDENTAETIIPETDHESSHAETNIPAQDEHETSVPPQEEQETTTPSQRMTLPNIMRGAKDRFDKARDDVREGMKNVREGTTKVLKDVSKGIPGLGGGIFKL